MKIAIFETGHFEVANALIRLFDEYPNEITVFTYPGSFSHLQFLLGENRQRYKWVIKNASESKARFIYTIYQAVKKEKYDILFCDTIEDNHLLYAALVSTCSRTRVIMTLHDINGWFTCKPSLNLKQLLRCAGKKILVRQIREFNVISSTMVSHLKNKLPVQKKVYCLPGAVFDKGTNTGIAIREGEKIKMVVPGSVDARRRNYDLVFELLRRINENSLPVSVTLLGGFEKKHGAGILQQCTEYDNRHSNLIFYKTGVVDQAEFDRVMNTSHLVFTPSVIDTVINDGVTETYGVSICSGNIFDIVRFAKPFIAPADLNIEPFLSGSCLRYKNVDDIIRHLYELLETPEKYRILNYEAVRASMQFTVAAVRGRNKALFYPAPEMSSRSRTKDKE